MPKPRGAPRLSLSVLDLCKRSPAIPARESLEDTIALARLADTLGYKRFWIAEHHTDDAAQSSPEVLLPLLASRTKRLRVGAGGVLLQYYSPLKVAETFLVLEALFPGRIDLGVCRGPGVTSQLTASALVRDHVGDLTPQTFDRNAAALANLLLEAPIARAAVDTLHARPLGVAPPPLWMLGAGPTSARLAAAHGAAYGYSLFFGGGLTDGVAFVEEYRRSFTRSTMSARPQAAIAVSMVCAGDESRARQLEAELVAQGCFTSNIVGSPSQCARMLRAFAQLFGVDEILVATFVQNREARQNLYRDLANELL